MSRDYYVKLQKPSFARARVFSLLHNTISMLIAFLPKIHLQYYPRNINEYVNTSDIPYFRGTSGISWRLALRDADVDT